ncbi:MAG TPA: hypothetical protein VFJ07_01950 [Streptosporangiaceae bacterium]|nr:hypothetical protein [Streptosporangiaceae bacterium]
MLRIPLALAVCLAIVLASGAGAAQASTLLLHRGVPGASGSGVSPEHGVLPQGNTVTQPAPPVTASAFPLEPPGTPPADGDGLIPNPATPAGSAIAPPSSCTVTFASASGATSATVNSWIAANENSITATTVLCLNGTFTGPIHVWSKSSATLLEIARAPGATATLDLGRVQAADTNPNQFFGDSGGVSIVDSRSVEIYGLTVKNYTFDGTAHSPAGIYVTVRSDTSTTSQSTIPHRSICWSKVQIWHNTITGMGRADRYNPLFEVDKQPNGGTNVVDCNDYGNLTKAGNTVNGNFALPSNDWLTLANWQAHNGHGWDTDSAVGGFSANCPSGSIS